MFNKLFVLNKYFNLIYLLSKNEKSCYNNW